MKNFSNLKLIFSLLFFTYPIISYSNPLVKENLKIDWSNNGVTNNSYINKNNYLENKKDSKYNYENNSQKMKKYINQSNRKNMNYKYKINLTKDSLKNSFEKQINSNFKDLSTTYISPFGKNNNRAPDENLNKCKSKECFE